MAPKQVQEDISRGALQFFLDHAHPTTGLVRDKAENLSETPAENRVASIASTGFALAVISHASTQGLVEKDFARGYCEKTLGFMRDHVARKYGWFLHWIDWETGERAWNSEYSTIDSALLFGGALYAAQIFPGTECARLANEIYRDVDFIAAMTDGGARPGKRSLSMAYLDDNGWTPAQWDMYAEQRLLLILGLGHPVRPLPPEAWLAFSRRTSSMPNGDKAMGLNEALFVHQYSEAFIDFRKMNDPAGDYWENGARISRIQREIAKRDKRFKTLKEGFWGFSAGESPSGYSVYSALNYQGTVCIGCTVASAMFMSETILDDLAGWLDSSYRDLIWGKYGFSDSIDLDQGWFSTRVLGITAGPAYMSLANMAEATSFWKDFMKIPEIQAGMERARSASLYIGEKIR